MKYIKYVTLFLLIGIGLWGCTALNSNSTKDTFQNKVELLDMVSVSNPIFKEKSTQTYTQIQTQQQIKLKHQVLDEVSKKDSIQNTSHYLEIRVAEYAKIIEAINNSKDESKLDLIKKEDNLEMVISLQLKISKDQKEKFENAISMSLDNSDSFRSYLWIYNKDGIEKLSLSEFELVDFETSCLCWQLQNNKPKLISINQKCPKGTRRDVSNLKSKSFKDYE